MRRRCGVNRSPSLRAFTLIELLLVVALILLSVGVALPALMRAYRGESLRAAARAVAAGHRLARGSALLRAEPRELRLWPKERRLAVVRAHASRTAEETNTLRADLIGGIEPQPGAVFDEPGEQRETERTWAPDVLLEQVETDTATYEPDTMLSLRYEADGRCPAFTVRLADTWGNRAAVRAHPLTGRVVIEYEPKR